MNIQKRNLKIINNPNNAFLEEYSRILDNDEQIVFLAILLCVNRKGEVTTGYNTVYNFINKNLRLLKEKQCLLNVKLKQWKK